MLRSVILAEVQEPAPNSFRVRTADGRQFAGTATEVIAAMHLRSMERDQPVGEYILALVARARDWFGEELVLLPEGTPHEERCAALLREALRTGLVEAVVAS